MPPTADLLASFFATDPARARLRRLVVVLVAGFGWVMAAMAAHPPTTLPDFLRALVIFIASLFSFGAPGGSFDTNTTPSLLTAGGALLREMAAGLFAPDVLRHGLVLGFPIFLAYHLAAAYLADVFELEDARTARRFIGNAAFGSRPFTITVAEGEVAPEDNASPLARIGGPGRVRVHLENAAVFERVDGTPHVIAPCPDESQPDAYVVAFERLRGVVDLRDQATRLNEINVIGRTRDGVRIAARDVRLLYSIQRAPIEALEDPDRLPYTFQTRALLSLIYERSYPTWSEVTVRLVRRHLQRFIASHTLSEVLAAVGTLEVRSRIIGETELRRQAETLYPGSSLESGPETLGTPLPKLGRQLVPRMALTDLFFSSTGGFQAQAARSGVQLHWIDVGTWALPNQIVAETQLEAWRLTSENEQSRQDLERRTRESRTTELLRLIREPLLGGYAQPGAAPTCPDDLAANLLFAYLGLFRSARDTFTHEDRPVPPPLDAAIDVLAKTTQHYLQQTGKADFL